MLDLWTWGNNARGEAGQGGPIGDIKQSPIQIGDLVDWNVVSAGQNWSSAIKEDGTLWTWGRNSNGQLGDGTEDDRSSPAQVGILTNWYKIDTSWISVLAIKTDNTLWSWGNSVNGQLGDGTVVAKSSPVQIGLLTNWAHVSSGHEHSTAIKTDGTLWTWGRNSEGRLGDGTTGHPANSKSSPIQIGLDTDWDKVETGYFHTLALKDGTLWSWGYNFAGQLGINTSGSSSNRSSPVQIGLDTDWADISAKNHSLARKTNGTLWAWGVGYYGEIGDGERDGGFGVSRSSPVQVGTDTDWTGEIHAGRNWSLAIKTNGELWRWGGNSYGQLAIGDYVDRSLPIQLGSLTTWKNANIGQYHTLATILEGGGSPLPGQPKISTST